ncbi:MAG: tetratricopeptide repeat protein, partial [Vampirovibrionales bacterium]|nr:tetratricopeptide repeat protein [Vampirovibrionales bacterium]
MVVLAELGTNQTWFLPVLAGLLLMGSLAGLIWFARQCDIKSLPELLTVKARPSRSKFLRLASKSSRDRGLADRIKIFEQLVQCCPDGWLGWFKLARLYRHNGQVEQSLDALNQVSRCQPGFTLAYFERARLY